MTIPIGTSCPQNRNSSNIFKHSFEIVANDDRLPPEKLEIRKKEHKAAKLARKAARGERPAEPMETEESKPPAEPVDVEMKDNNGSFSLFPPLLTNVFSNRERT